MPETQVRAALLGLHAQTALHPGAGTALGVVDLPVQRERHTHWPTIPGSALKGVLRDACRERFKDQYDDDPEGKPERRTRRDKANQEDKRLHAAFGPHTDSASESAGALSVTDARLLAFPVRSLRGVFAWVTCPAVLERLRRDLGLHLKAESIGWEVPSVERNRILVPNDDCPCLVERTHVVLEEFPFQREALTCGPIAAWVADNVLPTSPACAATRARFVKSFLVLSNDDFTHFARYATEVVARVGLDYDTKTVRDGALFYEEFLPPETVFYSIVLAHAARTRAADGLDAAAIVGVLEETLPPIIQVGANETTGKGYCATRLWKEGGT
jgi:CRISPR-associated protein Cmr4